MVKGVSRQVIVVQSPGEQIFDQAIFILKEDALGEGVTDEHLLKEARQILNESRNGGKLWDKGPLWACGGAVFTALLWLAVTLL